MIKTLKDVNEIDENFVYSDIDIFMNIENNDIMLLKDYDSIYQSVWNILKTTPGEMPMLTDFGIDLKKLIFEQNTNNNKIVNTIINGVESWEDRVKIVDILVKSDKIDSNVIKLDFIFQIGNETILQSYTV
jgi:phage baseplate assembly protein W